MQVQDTLYWHTVVNVGISAVKLSVFGDNALATERDLLAVIFYRICLCSTLETIPISSPIPFGSVLNRFDPVSDPV